MMDASGSALAQMNWMYVDQLVEGMRAKLEAVQDQLRLLFDVRLDDDNSRITTSERPIAGRLHAGRPVAIHKSCAFLPAIDAPKYVHVKLGFDCVDGVFNGKRNWRNICWAWGVNEKVATLLRNHVNGPPQDFLDTAAAAVGKDMLTMLLNVSMCSASKRAGAACYACIVIMPLMRDQDANVVCALSV